MHDGEDTKVSMKEKVKRLLSLRSRILRFLIKLEDIHLLKLLIFTFLL